MTESEYMQCDAIDLAQKVKDKEVTPEELLNIAREIAQRWNPHLNAIVDEFPERALQRIEEADPEAALYGVPFLIKDLGIAYDGVKITNSCRAFKDYVSTWDSELLVRYKKAGLIPFGLTNTPEFGLKGVTDSEFRGACRNPWNLNHTPGGSSGGSAAAVAAGVVPVAHASDGGGSIRIPASACGLVGLKPSRGRMPMGPRSGDSWMGQVCNHVVSRSVRDTAHLLDLTHGMDPGSPYVAPEMHGLFTDAIQKPLKKLKIGYSFQSLYGKSTHPECRAALEDSIQLCQDLGHEVEEHDLQLDKEELVRSYMIIVSSAMAAEMRDAKEAIGRNLKASDMEDASWLLTIIGRAVSGEDLAHAVNVSRVAGRVLGEYFKKFDLFMLPTMAYPPTRIGELDFSVREKRLMKMLAALPLKPLLLKAMDEIVETSFEKIPNTELFNQTGNPAISLPLYWGKNGLPIGTQFVSAYGEDALLLRLGRQMEEARPWKERRPSLEH